MNIKQAGFFTAMRDRYTALTGIIPDEASDVALRFHALAAQLADMEDRLDTAQRSLFAQTAVGAALDAHAAARGLARKEAVRAEGILLFSRGIPGLEITIPAGTQCGTAEGITYETLAPCVIPVADSEGQASARAIQGGGGGNAAAGMIERMLQPLGGVSGVYNPLPFTGGKDAETDNALRMRVLSDYAYPSNGVNGGFYQRIATGFPGISSAVATAGGAPGQVTVYLAAEGLTAVPETVKAGLQAELNAQREPCAQVTAVNATAVQVPLSLEIEPAGDFDNAKSALSGILTREIGALPIGKKITLARLSQLVMDSGLAENCRFTAPGADVVPEPLQVLRPGIPLIARIGG